MTPLEKRAAQAGKILESPRAYKICEGCGSIVAINTVICPVCKAYRFDEDPDRVCEQARELGSREARTITEDDL